MNLHARTVQLPLDRCIWNAGQSICNVVGGLREHRRKRLKQCDRKCFQTLMALRQRWAGDRRDATSDHRCATNIWRGKIRCVRDGFDHQAFQRSLPQLSEQQPHEERLLAFGGGGK